MCNFFCICRIFIVSLHTNSEKPTFLVGTLQTIRLHIIRLFICVWWLGLASIAYGQDTIHTQDLLEVVDMEDLLWQLMHEQAVQLHLEDSLRQDSLYNDLLLQQAELTLQLQHVNDSLNLMRPTMPHIQKQIADSIEKSKQDAVSQLTERDRKLALDIAPALVYDAQEDVQELREAIRAHFSPWRWEVNLSLQFTQNYISPNWYKGGNSNFAALGIQKGEVWYDKNKLSWYSLGEWRLGGTTVVGDSLRHFNFTDDLFRVYSKIGYEVFKNFDISSSVDFQTNFFDVWNANQRTAKTATFTPIRFNVAVGLDYKPIKNMSIVISPLAYKLVYAWETDPQKIDVTQYGIAVGNNLMNDIGSSLRFTYKWQPLREVKLDTELYLYTNYKKVEIDWEINCNFIITRFISARLTLHPRFDNTVLSDDDRAHLQFKELLSIGFAHRFK